jgi:hypothetical protein
MMRFALQLASMAVTAALLPSTLLPPLPSPSIDRQPSLHARAPVQRVASRRVHPRMGEPDPDEDASKRSDGESRDIADRLNALLDQQVFDPEDESDRDEPQAMSDFRQLFRNDPEMATALYAGTYFALLLCVTQQVVRVYKHCYFMPDKTCPFDLVRDIDAFANMS